MANLEKMTSSLLELEPTMPDKIVGTKWSDPVKLDRKKSLVSAFACFLTAIRKV